MSLVGGRMLLAVPDEDSRLSLLAASEVTVVVPAYSSIMLALCAFLLRHGMPVLLSGQLAVPGPRLVSLRGSEPTALGQLLTSVAIAMPDLQGQLTAEEFVQAREEILLKLFPTAELMPGKLAWAQQL